MFFFFILLVFLCNSVSSSKDFEDVVGREIDPPTTATPSVTTPPIDSAPGIVTMPGTNPVNPPVTNPVSPPVTNPVSPPVTNPVSPPVTNPVSPPVTNPVSPPVTNPVSPPVTNPVSPPVTNPVNPPAVTNPVNPPVTNPVNPPVPVVTPPTASGGNGRWCIAKNGASQAALQSALDYACGIGGADCATIQQGSSCYEPPTLQNHASYAFNSYYQKNPVPTSCDFGGAAALTTTNPSTGTCVYPSSSPTTQAPVNPTSLPTAPTTSSSGPTFPGTQYPPPAGLSLGNPDPRGLGAFGASPPLTNTAYVSNSLRPFIGSLVTLAYIVMFGL